MDTLRTLSIHPLAPLRDVEVEVIVPSYTEAAMRVVQVRLPVKVSTFPEEVVFYHRFIGRLAKALGIESYEGKQLDTVEDDSGVLMCFECGRPEDADELARGLKRVFD